LACLGIVAVSTVPAKAASKWGEEWDKTLELAKKEGSVSVALGSSTLRETRPIWDIFQKKFGIKVVVSGGSGSKVTRRILAERARKRTEVDLVGIGTASVLTQLVPNHLVVPVEPLLFLPEVLDNSVWWEGKRWYADPEQKYMIMYTLVPGDSGIGINTNLVKDGDIKSYWDVFDPKYDGKRVSGALSLSQGANSIADMVALAGKDWLIKWIESKPIFVADSDIGINYLIEGRAALGMFLSGELQNFDDLAKQGAPVKRITTPMKEGTRAGRGNCCFVLMADPPHPNAQKLLINWLMSKEGQTIMQNYNERSNSPREDVPKDKLAPDVLRTPGAHYVLMTQKPDYNELFKQAMDIVKKAQAEIK
jgi:iron(III) transport system substrate-binding protein